MNSFKQYIYYLKRFLLYSFPKQYVLRRTACLGSTVAKKVGLDSHINHQKSRIDYLMDIHTNKDLSAKPEAVKQYLKNKAIFSCIKDQQYDFFMYSIPKMIVMDSFSELTDQLFVHKAEGWKFLANYSDINHTAEFLENFRCEDLLPLESLYDAYDAFFAELFGMYKTKVIFIHFPTTLDERKKFIIRGNEIKRVIDDLAKKYSLLFPFSLSDTEIFHAVDKDGKKDCFPYHFGEKTYDNFQEIIRALVLKYAI